LQDIQVATTISVASILTLDSDTDELQDHISVLDQGVNKATNMWLEFDEDLVVYDKGPAVVSLSVIIKENLQKLTSPPTDNTTDLLSTDTTGSALSIPPIPTLAEALSQLDDLNRFFQSMSISTLAFPHTPTQLSIQDLVDTIGQAHDYRQLSERVYLDPEPVDTVPDILAWLGQGETGSFSKVGADRGLIQIEGEAGEAVDATAFELFSELWCSNRLFLGMKNGPATFKRNAFVMQGMLLHKKTKSYFDDIFGKALRGDYVALRVVWRLLLRLRNHGWKCKLVFIWSAEGIAMASKNVDAMKAMELPQSRC